MNERELKKYESIGIVRISKTDLKNLIIAKNRDMPLLTNDSKLYAEGVKRGVKVYDLRQMLRTIHEEELLSKRKLRDIVQKIEEKDNTKINDIETIFD